MLHPYLRSNEEEIALFEASLCILDFSLEYVGRDGALIYIEKCDVIVGNFVQENDELDEVGVGLLPEGFLAPPEEVVEQRCDAVGKSIRVEFVVQGIVAIFGVETDLDVVLLSFVERQYVSDLMAEIAFDFEHKTANAVN